MDLKKFVVEMAWPDGYISIGKPLDKDIAEISAAILSPLRDNGITVTVKPEAPKTVRTVVQSPNGFAL
jgi:hypothetical protein